MSGCHGCGAELPPAKSSGRPRKWCTDRCRKDHSYRRFCLDCGDRLNGSDGNGPNASIRCPRCNNRRIAEMRTIWTRETVIAAMQRWADRFGEPPRIRNWNPNGAREIGHPEMSVVYEAELGDWPSVTSVCHVFGSWNAAIVASGFKPRPANHRGKETVA